MGTAAVKDAGTLAGNVMPVGAFGLGAFDAAIPDDPETLLAIRTGIYKTPYTNATLTVPGGGNGFVLQLGGTQNTYCSQIGKANTGNTYYWRDYRLGVTSRWFALYSEGNTTKASDGTLKAASPIVKILHDGQAETNGESEGCVVTRLGVGRYLIENCIGMNADASWGGINGGFDIPKDRNGQALIWLDFEVNADGSVLVQTYHRTYPEAPVFARNEIDGIADGDPVDIPVDQFVSVRVEMPQDSIWNQKMAAIQVEPEISHSPNEAQAQEE